MTIPEKSRDWVINRANITLKAGPIHGLRLTLADTFDPGSRLRLIYDGIVYPLSFNERPDRCDPIDAVFPAGATLAIEQVFTVKSVEAKAREARG